MDYGILFARKVFAKRGNHSEVHLSEAELAALIAVAAEHIAQAVIKKLSQPKEAA